eukprot:TRINITY_DN60991_c0_g1_i1.p1 TRINITY_DN60991_c0_g1~~TRINITY_DN60991_c0_g1_i1.p1  ORF type:complete len:295 (-),score=29.07 TRINITY_DN60991_c0_g1_i1:208-1092(-)
MVLNFDAFSRLRPVHLVAHPCKYIIETEQISNALRSRCWTELREAVSADGLTLVDCLVLTADLSHLRDAVGFSEARRPWFRRQHMAALEDLVALGVPFKLTSSTFPSQLICGADEGLDVLSAVLAARGGHTLQTLSDENCRVSRRLYLHEGFVRSVVGAVSRPPPTEKELLELRRLGATTRVVFVDVSRRLKKGIRRTEDQYRSLKASADRLKEETNLSRSELEQVSRHIQDSLRRREEYKQTRAWLIQWHTAEAMWTRFTTRTLRPFFHCRAGIITSFLMGACDCEICSSIPL